MWIIFLVNALSGSRDPFYTHYGPLFWIAGQRIDPSRESAFVWRMTTTDTCCDKLSNMTYTNWGSGQPNYFLKNQSCALLMSNKSSTWNDYPCTSKFCSVCEIDMTPFSTNWCACNNSWHTLAKLATMRVCVTSVNCCDSLCGIVHQMLLSWPVSFVDITDLQILAFSELFINIVNLL